LSSSNTRPVAFETDSGIERADVEAETNERSDNGRCWRTAQVQISAVTTDEKDGRGILEHLNGSQGAPCVDAVQLPQAYIRFHGIEFRSTWIVSVISTRLTLDSSRDVVSPADARRQTFAIARPCV
jgi:hypothetical protein